MPADLKEALAASAANYADLRQAQYVAPRGLGLHLVLILPSQTPIIVGAASGSTTWARGAIVLTGTPQGSRQRVIIGNPAPGLGGGGAFPASNQEGDLDIPQILLVTPTDIPRGATSTVYVVGLLLRTEAPFDTWEIVYRSSPDAEYFPDPFAFVVSVAAVPDPGAVGLSLSDPQVAVALSIAISPTCPIGRGFTLRMRR